MIISSLQLIAKRSVSHWRLLSAVIVGVLLAVTIMSGSVVYFESLRDLALGHALARQPERQLDIMVRASQDPVNVTTHENLTGLINSRVVGPFSRFLRDERHGLKSSTFYLGGPDAIVPPPASDGRRAFFASIPGMENDVTLVAGELPQPVPGVQPGQPLQVEAMISSSTAEAFELAVGDIFIGTPFWDDVHDEVSARITGIYERSDPADKVWRIYDDVFVTRGTSLVFADLVVPPETMLGAIGPYLPRMGSTYVWMLDVDPDRITAADTGALQSVIAGVRTDLRSTLRGYQQETGLGQILADYDRNLFFNRLPMFIVLILIVIVVLYYVITLAALLVDSQRAEIALLRSRGATSRQIMAVYVLESAGLAALAVAIGPIMAAGAVSVIGIMPWFGDLNQGQMLPVRLSGGVYQMALIGGLLSLLALFVPAVRASRIGLLRQKQSMARPERAPAFQRYYLDIGVLALVLFLFWQLAQQGSLVAVQVFGELAVDHLVLAVPALFMVAAGLVLLRIFPLMMDLLGRLLSSRFLYDIAPPSFVLGLWQMARNPAHYSRLSLLLILTAGLGVFAASFGGTLERSFSERVLYDTGADLRVTNVDLLRGRTISLADEVSALPGVHAASPVLRDNGYLLSGGRSQGFISLAVDPATLADVAWFRDDFTGSSLSESLSLIETPGDTGIVLPDDAHYLTVLVRSAAERPEVQLVARLSDANGRFYSLPLGTLAPEAVNPHTFHCPDGPGEWCRIGSTLSPHHVEVNPPVVPVSPITLHSIGVARPASQSLGPGRIDIEDIAVLSTDLRRLTVVEGFNDLSRWQVLVNSPNSQADTFTHARDATGEVIDGIARFQWAQGTGREFRGVSLSSSTAPVRALASRSFLDRFGFSVGDTIKVSTASVPVDVVLTGVADYFPTLDPHASPFLLTDINAMLRHVNAGRFTGDIHANEIWVRTSGSALGPAAGNPGLSARELEQALGTLPLRFRGLVDRQARAADVEIDPLVSAGWKALLGMSFFTVLTVSAIGFLVHSRVSFKSRIGELALLRTIGLSMRQLLSLVLLEQVLVIGTAIALGIFMGARLGATIMPYLAASGEGVRVAPPMLVHVDWAGFGATFGVIGGVFAFVVAVILISVYRMSIHRVMRMGEG